MARSFLPVLALSQIAPGRHMQPPECFVDTLRTVIAVPREGWLIRPGQPCALIGSSCHRSGYYGCWGTSGRTHK